MPLLETQGLPLGLQMIGFQNKDAEMFAAAGAVLPLFSS
jgi:Asp-tRNA(Asn)/Glu-tRNA(Gln) amidotransferase A subunit family amidase